MTDADGSGLSWAATRTWVEKVLAEGERIESVQWLRGGWTSQMRRLYVTGPHGPRSLVLRSFVKPFFLQHAPGLLSREAEVLELLGSMDVPAADLIAVDATGEHCDHPSLLMSLLPGDVRLDDAGAPERVELLARQLVDIHRVRVTEATRPRDYQAWTAPERVRVPEATDRPALWRRAVDVIRREPPLYKPHFLHRDFHPGNVLFTGVSADADLRISGVVDWVETSWGPSDLDVAHCSTNLALLHGVPVGMSFAERYVSAGGQLSESPLDHLYWRLLDALAFAPDAEKVGVPWRELGRLDLTADVLAGRLEEYMQSLFDHFG
ncbi:aminoglycoside phosphotransferase family protein [Streptomyces sp.]|uniref:phosphotransferase family protein n=1 Tax=Streptomyces sp. TaxID=1931 RepID=UPI002D768B31|nr:aminoglycoside phosphotransferase family protein [Streptomyces sp.]HET6355631.1 aminoglycoside phosphotransferase family protein [Streptomyces sp.]